MMPLQPKRNVVAYAVKGSAVTIELSCEKASGTLQENSNISCQTSTIAAVHYTPAEVREVHMN